MGLAYATVIVLGLYRPSDQEPLGLPSRQSGEGGQVTTIGPVDVRAEDEALSSSSASASATPSTPADASPVADEPANETTASPPASDAGDDSAEAAAPSADEPDPTPSGSSDDEDDDSGNLIDVNLLGIRISL